MIEFWQGYLAGLVVWPFIKWITNDNKQDSFLDGPKWTRIPTCESCGGQMICDGMGNEGAEFTCTNCGSEKEGD